MNEAEKKYEKLKALSKHAYILAGISHLLDWDQETYMPPGGAMNRAMQLETMAGIIHAEKTSKKFGSALGALIDLESGKVKESGLSLLQKAALREWRKDYKKDTALPRSFVEQFAKLTSEAVVQWREARKQSDFDSFSPYLERIVSLSRQKAEYLGYPEHPYDALLDLYEPEMSARKVQKLFSTLKPFLVDLVKRIRKKQPDDSFLEGSFSHQKQLEFSKRLLHAMGYDEQHGRLDLSTHPFSSSSHPTDTRITTRFHPTSFMNCISVVLHEAGHALYERGLPVEQFGTPIGSAISLGMHESQSRWWETLIGQSKPFWSYYLPLLKKQFKGKLEDVTLDQFYRAINKVQPSFIRVDADEVTYNLHIILRFEMEKALIEGILKVADVPEVWRAKMQELFGICPKTDAEGCLQDIHWAMGGFGYFPSYTLGNLYASHFFTGFLQDYPDWQQRVAAGELLFIAEWLHAKIHQYGREYSSHELLKRVAKRPFTPDAFMHYLSGKYKSLSQ